MARTRKYKQLGSAMIQVAMLVKDGKVAHISRIDGVWRVK